ncbi:MAG: metal ABC transporter permease [Nitrospira sp.]|nr:metal ABC transporter permease [Nitrospira sp.]
MTTISEFLTYPFIQRALFASLMVGILCPFVGNFVLLRRMSFFSDAISHSAFAGLAAGALLGVDLSISSMVVAIMIALMIAFMSEKSGLSHDTVIGVAFSGAIATGMLILGMLKGYRAEVFNYLFGDILAVSKTDLVLLMAVSVLTIALIIVFLKPLLQLTFNRDLARVDGINVRLFEYMLFVIIAIVVTVSLKIVGLILVTSMLIVPAASARNMAKSMKGLLALSCLFGMISGITGMLGSLYLNTSSGPTIVLCSIGIFFITLFAGPRMNN